MSKLRVENLTKIFGDNEKEALDLMNQGKTKEEILAATGATLGVNQATFDVKAGEIFVIMGLSGSGKSTLVRMLNRLIEPTNGNVYIDEANVSQMNKNDLRDIRRKKISMVFQNFGLFPHRTILENTEYGLEVQGVPRAERQEKAEQALDNAGLLPYKDQFPDQLSGGMQQRVQIAKALSNYPPILLLDEVTTGLDLSVQADVLELIKEIQRDMGVSMIVVSHDLAIIRMLCDRTMVMLDGKVIEHGITDQILEDPQHEYTQQLVYSIL